MSENRRTDRVLKPLGLWLRARAGLLLVLLSIAVLKLILAAQIPASALFADDYDYLNRGIYYGSGHIDFPETYPFRIVRAGLAYPMLISSWTFFDLENRLFWVFAVNVVLSTGTAYWGSRTITLLTGRFSVLYPVLIALLAPVFQSSYYVMTENLLYCLLALAAWLVADLERTIGRPARFGLLLGVVALLPLTRAPGLAGAAAVLAVVAANRSRLGLFKTVRTGSAVLLAGAVPYLLYLAVVSASREAGYARSATRKVLDATNWLPIAQLFLAQWGYLFYAGAFLAVPFALLGLLWLTRLDAPLQQPWKNFGIFMLVNSGLLVAFCVLHLINKFGPVGLNHEKATWFVFGRYDDPALLLLSLGGIAGIVCLAGQAGRLMEVLRILLPALAAILLLCFNPVKWVPINQAGLSLDTLFRGGVMPDWMLVVTAVGFALVYQAGLRRSSGPLLAAMLLFALGTDLGGTLYTLNRARRVDYSMQGAQWIAHNTPPSARIGYDYKLLAVPSPKSIKTMLNVYRGMMFRTFPRRFVPFRSIPDFADCDYLYTLNDRASELGRTVVWTNGDYALLDARKARAGGSKAAAGEP